MCLPGEPLCHACRTPAPPRASSESPRGQCGRRACWRCLFSGLRLFLALRRLWLLGGVRPGRGAGHLFLPLMRSRALGDVLLRRGTVRPFLGLLRVWRLGEVVYRRWTARLFAALLRLFDGDGRPGRWADDIVVSETPTDALCFDGDCRSCKSEHEGSKAHQRFHGSGFLRRWSARTDFRPARCLEASALNEITVSQTFPPLEPAMIFPGFLE
jgi:hypothetical protein